VLANLSCLRIHFIRTEPEQLETAAGSRLAVFHAEF